jgi:hypothetical protein
MLFLLGAQLFCFGGAIVSLSRDQVHNELFVLDVVTFEWKHLKMDHQNKPMARDMGTSGYHFYPGLRGGRVALFGGFAGGAIKNFDEWEFVSRNIDDCK